MQPRDRSSLLDICEQGRLIREHIAGITPEDFLDDSLRQAAVMLRIAIIGEAATRLSEEFRSNHPEVDWQVIRRMRNFLVHVYDQVNYETVWDTVQQDIPLLLAAIERMLTEDAEDE